jgi:hypothetical protein
MDGVIILGSYFGITEKGKKTLLSASNNKLILILQLWC